MANLIVNNLHNLKLRVNSDETWDLFVNKAPIDGYLLEKPLTEDTECLVSKVDFSSEDTYSGISAYSSGEYLWDGAYSNPYTLRNIGFTGVDNGLIRFRKDRITNMEFYKLYTDSRHDIDEDLRLKLHQVSGNTLLYEYPSSFDGESLRLNGGFYQGCFKTENGKYQVLPSKMCNGDEWVFEFTLKKEEFEKESEKTLNDKYPDNKGMFFFMGTRAENKWIYFYNEDTSCTTLSIDDYVEDAKIDPRTYGLNGFEDIDPYTDVDFGEAEIGVREKTDNKLYKYDYLGEEIVDCCGTRLRPQGEPVVFARPNCGCNEKREEEEEEKCIAVEMCDLFEGYVDDDALDYDTDFIEPEVDISNFEYETLEDGFSVFEGGQRYIETDNKFLTFDRTCKGFTIKNYDKDALVRYYWKERSKNYNLFLLMDRTCSGYTVDTIDRYIEESGKTEYDEDKDLYKNAIAFRITDDGEIGYRYCMKDCENDGNIIKEAYSKKGLIREGEWYSVHVKVSASEKKMRLRFYINNNLVFISTELPKFDFRQLDDQYTKQEMVPFNISLGGGTQGLCDTILPNYMLEPYREYEMERRFGGSFIGYMKTFKFYNCHKDYVDIVRDYRFEIGKIRQ